MYNVKRFLPEANSEPTEANTTINGHNYPSPGQHEQAGAQAAVVICAVFVKPKRNDLDVRASTGTLFAVHNLRLLARHPDECTV